MGFNFQTARLQRGSPWDKLPNPVDQFAEELMSMFSPDIPVTAKDLTVQNSGNGKGITFEGYNPSDSIFSMNIQGSTYNFSFDPDAGLTYSGPSGVPVSASSGSGGGSSETSAFTGTVLSGSGSTYQVRIDTGVGSTAVVTVTQKQIDSGATIPAGSGVVVVKIGSSYKMQFPVWA